MNGEELIGLYREGPFWQDHVRSFKGFESIRIKGLSGSLPGILLGTASLKMGGTHLVILGNREDARYFFDDLRNLFSSELAVYYFPPSFKKVYEFEEIENANVVSRAEVLSAINSDPKSNKIIVSCTEAICEKVVSRKKLTTNSFLIKKPGELNLESLMEFLVSHEFEKVDFVLEPGQFAIRGGIIDVFSFSGDLPFRIELLGSEVESIREFDPSDQLSSSEKQNVQIVPNIRSGDFLEDRVSLFKFLPSSSSLWVGEGMGLLDQVNEIFERASLAFQEIKGEGGQDPVVFPPEQIFLNDDQIKEELFSFRIIDFGTALLGRHQLIIDYRSGPQPSFNKNFDLIGKELKEKKEDGYKLFIATDQLSSIERLEGIFSEIDASLDFSPMLLGLKEGFVDYQAKILCFTEHQLFERFYRFKSKSRFSKAKALSKNQLKDLETGDYVTHIDFGVGRFVGLEKRELNGKVQESIRLIYRDNDILLVGIHALHKISKYSGRDGLAPTISKLGSPEWENKKKKAKRKVKDIAKGLIDLYAKRKSSPGFQFSPDSYLQAELESSFLYEDTPDQAEATKEVKEDMEEQAPMDRLVCGDVGFGKTEVAIRAAFKAVADGKQVAVLVPTTVLALQHYKTFRDRLKDFPVEVDYLNRFRTAAQQGRIKKNLAEGKIDILIGTHKMVGKSFEFKDLGLLIIDEEQKFGVSTKEKLKEIRVNVDVLTLTATPIPRTLHFSLMGAKDLSVIATPPPNRQAVETEVMVFNEKLIRDAISFELARNGQVFFVHNRIKDIDEIAGIVKKLIPEARIAVAHGQMDGKLLEKTMVGFIEKQFDILVSTNIIESGLDIPNANTIIINQAHSFGLSDLHQMRGRVGRSNKKAFCFFLTPPMTVLSPDSRKRLQTLSEFSEIGDGYKVAMRDLDIRGAGNLLGGEQSGFINDLGLDTYHKILDEAVQELKENEFKELFQNKNLNAQLSRDCSLETDWEVLIPESYISNISERLRIYTRLDNLKSEEEVPPFIQELTDRFGTPPKEVGILTQLLHLRWNAQDMGFQKLTVKNGRMKCYFVDNRPDYFQGEVFGKILSFVKLNPSISSMKEVKGSLWIRISGIDNVDKAINTLQRMNE